MLAGFSTFLRTRFLKNTRRRKPHLHPPIHKYWANFHFEKVRRSPRRVLRYLCWYCFPQPWKRFYLLQWSPWFMPVMVNIFHIPHGLLCGSLKELNIICSSVMRYWFNLSAGFWSSFFHKYIHTAEAPGLRVVSARLFVSLSVSLSWSVLLRKGFVFLFCHTDRFSLATQSETGNVVRIIERLTHKSS